MLILTHNNKIERVSVGQNLCGVGIVCLHVTSADLKHPHFREWLHDTILPRMFLPTHPRKRPTLRERVAAFLTPHPVPGIATLTLDALQEYLRATAPKPTEHATLLAESERCRLLLKEIGDRLATPTPEPSEVATIQIDAKPMLFIDFFDRLQSQTCELFMQPQSADANRAQNKDLP